MENGRRLYARGVRSWIIIIRTFGKYSKNVSRVADAIASDEGERKLTGDRARKEGRKNRRKDIKGAAD